MRINDTKNIKIDKGKAESVLSELLYIAQVYEGRAAQISDLAEWMHLAWADIESSPRKTKFFLYERQLKDIASGMFDEADMLRKSNV